MEKSTGDGGMQTLGLQAGTLSGAICNSSNPLGSGDCLFSFDGARQPKFLVHSFPKGDGEYAPPYTFYAAHGRFDLASSPGLIATGQPGR